MLSWISGDVFKLKTFVRNRVTDILQVEGEWRYVPTADNPADMASRGVRAYALSTSRLWEKGPVWLADHSSWPEQPASIGDPQTVAAVVTGTCSESVEPFFSSLAQRTSTITRFVRIVAWVFRFIHNSRQTVDHRSEEFLSTEEMESSLHCSLRHEQEVSFCSEIQALKDGLPIPKNSPLSRLRPSWDPKRQLLVTTPRTNESPKIMLPRASRLTELIILDIHIRSSHVGVDHTLARFQILYWTSRARLLVKRIVRECRKFMNSSDGVFSNVLFLTKKSLFEVFQKILEIF